MGVEICFDAWKKWKQEQKQWNYLAKVDRIPRALYTLRVESSGDYGSDTV
jgi:hypothetical protein